MIMKTCVTSDLATWVKSFASVLHNISCSTVEISVEHFQHHLDGVHIEWRPVIVQQSVLKLYGGNITVAKIKQGCENK